MKNPPSVVSHTQVPWFFVLSLFAWLIWIPQAARRFELVGWAPSLQSPLNALTVWAPGLAAMFLSHRAAGATGVKQLFKLAGSRKGSWRDYLTALLLAPSLWVAAFFIDRIVGQRYDLGPALLQSAFSAKAAFMIPIAVIFTLPNALGEELGWRAFALPRLQARHGPLVASVIIGLFWGVWHIPAWFAWDVAEPSIVPTLLMTAHTVPMAILFTWLFNNTGGSLLIVVLFHASIANKGYFLPELPTHTETALIWVTAFGIIATGSLGRPFHPLADPGPPGK